MFQLNIPAIHCVNLFPGISKTRKCPKLIVECIHDSHNMSDLGRRQRLIEHIVKWSFAAKSDFKFGQIRSPPHVCPIKKQSVWNLSILALCSVLSYAILQLLHLKRDDDLEKAETVASFNFVNCSARKVGLNVLIMCQIHHHQNLEKGNCLSEFKSFAWQDKFVFIVPRWPPVASSTSPSTSPSTSTLTSTSPSTSTSTPSHSSPSSSSERMVSECEWD